ncbi:DUF2218 domain-containing protein [Rhizobium sp. SL42]|uniref:DUF2218 domain-containing protein n=1 Tax=Rhizobium sp. SL42 TaxID=2806346 RepID=UPI001F1908F0|nr:DUF2218 domain-containing protein [Rhizobium sp. SL42]UJW76948.1 DUF2218 domain-containing protein [Rhizobium sp. SL42]
MINAFTLSGIAVPVDAQHMLDEVFEHFDEHAEVRREGTAVFLSTEIGIAEIRIVDNKLAIELSCPSQQALQIARGVIAEHLFMFAGDDPFELGWSDAVATTVPPTLREITVVRAETITPHMRRLTVTCDDVTSYLEGGLHVRLLMPPKNRTPVWPSIGADGRLCWPKGENELGVRIYTIRAVDVLRKELLIDFVQHQGNGVAMPGADFARDAKPGDIAALMGPGGSSVPKASDIVLVGDETALPAIARIAAEVPAQTRLRAFIEVEDEREEQALVSGASFELHWLHRKGRQTGTNGLLVQAMRNIADDLAEDTYVWAGCERLEAQQIRDMLKARGHNRHLMSVSAYWIKEDDKTESEAPV